MTARDPIGPAYVGDDPRPSAALDLAQRVLAPKAGEVEGRGVPRAHLEALGRVGLCGLSDAARPAPGPVSREVGEVVAGACGSTWLSWAQHHTPTSLVTAARSTSDAPYADDLREDIGPALCSGSVISGVAMAHLRRAGAPAVTARREGRTWVISGKLDWVTSWTIADHWLLASVVVDEGGRPTGRLLWSLLDAGWQTDPEESPGVSAAGPVRLAAMGGAWTAEVTLDEARVAPDRVVMIEDLDAWRRRDAAKTVNVTPAAFGVARSCLTNLLELGQLRDNQPAIDAAYALAGKVRAVRSEAYALIDDVDPAAEIQRRLELRAQALLLTIEAASALVAACGGAAMNLGHPAQRWYREAGFHLVQAQTADVRSQTLVELAVRAAGELTAQPR